MAFGGLIGNNVKLFQHKILLAITLLCEDSQHANVYVLSEVQLSSTTVKLFTNSLQYTVSTYGVYNRNYLPNAY